MERFVVPLADLEAAAGLSFFRQGALGGARRVEYEVAGRPARQSSKHYECTLQIMYRTNPGVWERSRAEIAQNEPNRRKSPKLVTYRSRSLRNN
jgi:hypothetical protein